MRSVGFQDDLSLLVPRLSADDEEKVPPPSRTPGQAEGEDEASERERPDDDALRRGRPSQAEGGDAEDEADEVPPEE